MRFLLKRENELAPVVENILRCFPRRYNDRPSQPLRQEHAVQFADEAVTVCISENEAAMLKLKGSIAVVVNQWGKVKCPIPTKPWPDLRVIGHLVEKGGVKRSDQGVWSVLV